MFDKGLCYFTAKAIDIKVSHIWSHIFLVKGLCGIRRVAFIESGQACYNADSQSVKRPTILFRSLPSRFDITRFSKRL